MIRKGFSLIETLFSLVVLSIALVPLFSLESTMLYNVSESSGYLDRIILAKSFLYDIQRDAMRIKLEKNVPETENNRHEKVVDDPAATLLYEKVAPDKNSALAHIDGLQIERVTVTWDHIYKKQRDVIINLV